MNEIQEIADEIEYISEIEHKDIVLKTEREDQLHKDLDEAPRESAFRESVRRNSIVNRNSRYHRRMSDVSFLKEKFKISHTSLDWNENVKKSEQIKNISSS